MVQTNTIVLPVLIFVLFFQLFFIVIQFLCFENELFSSTQLSSGWETGVWNLRVHQRNWEVNQILAVVFWGLGLHCSQQYVNKLALNINMGIGEEKITVRSSIASVGSRKPFDFLFLVTKLLVIIQWPSVCSASLRLRCRMMGFLLLYGWSNQRRLVAIHI